VLQANPAGFFSALRPGSPDLLFVGTRNASSANTLYALDPASGATVTSFDNGGGPPIGIITGIAVDYLTARVYFTSRGAGGGSPDTLWCLAWTGSSLGSVWSLDVGDVDGSPVLHGGRIYVGTNAGEVKAIDPAGPTVKWTYSTGDDAVKGYVAPQFGSTPLRLFFSTTTQVWAIDAGDTSAAFAWSVATIPGPSTPLFVPGSTDLLVGSSNGALYQLSTGGAVTGSLSLGTGGLGSPARDAVNELVHVGSTAGVLHTVALPLP
jgi:outer membrane protein assembly factor BamB